MENLQITGRTLTGFASKKNNNINKLIFLNRNEILRRCWTIRWSVSMSFVTTVKQMYLFYTVILLLECCLLGHAPLVTSEPGSVKWTPGIKAGQTVECGLQKRRWLRSGKGLALATEIHFFINSISSYLSV